MKEILDKIAKMEQELAELKNSLLKNSLLKNSLLKNSLKKEDGWEDGQTYFYVNMDPWSPNFLDVYDTGYSEGQESSRNPNSLNMFKTKEEAKQASAVIANVLFRLSKDPSKVMTESAQKRSKKILDKVLSREVIPEELGGALFVF